MLSRTLAVWVQAGSETFWPLNPNTSLVAAFELDLSRSVIDEEAKALF